jgi:hypothetical protein
MTFHQLRHTAATILLLKNVNPKVVSEMLGHATIAITLDTYSHVLPNMQHSAVAAMEEAFSQRVGVRIGVVRAGFTTSLLLRLRVSTAKRGFSKWAMPYRTSDLLLVREDNGVSEGCR